MIAVAIKCAVALVAAYILVVAIVYAGQRSLLYHPDTNAYSQAQVGTPQYRNIAVKTEDGLLIAGWYAPPAENMPVLLVFHGNASTWHRRAPGFVPLVERGYGVLLAGYRGYGGNTGKPSEQGFYRDARAYLGFLTDKESIPLNRVVLYGESLGTGVAIHLAAERPGLRALILETPYTSMADLAAHHYPFIPFARALSRDRYENLYKIGTVTAPKLFLVAGRDVVIPAAFADTLYENTPAPKARKLYKTAGHNDIRDLGGLNDVADFLEKIN